MRRFRRGDAFHAPHGTWHERAKLVRSIGKSAERPGLGLESPAETPLTILAWME
jgi:hypothetical protein